MQRKEKAEEICLERMNNIYREDVFAELQYKDIKYFLLSPRVSIVIFNYSRKKIQPGRPS
ncbi:hypothetical protein [uncultured Alistipes sp.]|uniref:hypothetical protein n=1 Tax=uncultured Alistipes sp. TaxID=538949 RepID=UPI00321F6603